MGDNASFLTSVQMQASSVGRDGDVLWINEAEIVGMSFLIPPEQPDGVATLTPAAPLSGGFTLDLERIIGDRYDRVVPRKTTPSAVLVWECRYCRRRYYTEKPPVVCEGSGGNACGASDYKALRMEVEDA